MCFNFKRHRRKTIRFVKDEFGWYADIPQYTREENEMVAGSDKLLDTVYDVVGGKNSELKLMVSDSFMPSELLLQMKKHDEEGATYIARGYLAELLGVNAEECWLCNVVHGVFGEHPRFIYVSFRRN